MKSGESSVVLMLLLVCQAGSGLAADLPIEAEPRHRLVLDTGKYRVFDVEIPGGDTSFFHSHQADSFAIRVSTAQVVNETPEGKRTEYPIVPGSVSYGTASQDQPYVHRVGAVSGDFRAITIELPPAGRVLPPVPTLPAPYVLEKATPRGAMYQLLLGPGAQVSLPHGGDVLLVCLENARVRAPETPQTRTDWNCHAGDYRLIQGLSPTQVENSGAQYARLAVLVLP